MEIIIISRSRWKDLPKKSLRLFPDATVCVHECEVQHYRKLTDKVLVHPDEIVGIGPIRQWVIDNVKDETVVICDDDITHVYSQVGYHKVRIEDPETAQAIVERTAILAGDAGLSVFGFQQGARPMSYSNCRPFSLATWTGGVVGVIGKDLKYDTSLLLRADIDFCLQSLMRDRFVLIDGRYSFIHTRFAGQGGNAAQRSSERHEREIAYLKRKWGQYLRINKAKGTIRLNINVER